MDTQKRIRELMEEHKWTDYRLAKEANLSHSTVTNICLNQIQYICIP